MDRDDIFTILGAFVALVILMFISPAFMFLCCYVGGWICKVTIGKVLVVALNTLFNTTYFTVDKIPLMAAALGWIGSYFKQSRKIKEKK